MELDRDVLAVGGFAVAVVAAVKAARSDTAAVAVGTHLVHPLEQV